MPVLSHWEATAETAKAATDCILSKGCGWHDALWMRCTCSMYSVIRCRKLRGSLKAMGMVIFDSSRPMHFRRMLHTLKSLRVNMGAGSDVLCFWMPFS